MEQVLFDEILILSVEENPHVYDKRRASYKDEKMNENTWLSIAASLNTDHSCVCQPISKAMAGIKPYQFELQKKTSVEVVKSVHLRVEITTQSSVIAVNVMPTTLFSVDGIGDSEMVFSEMRPRFAIDYMAFALRLGKPGKNPTSWLFNDAASTTRLFSVDKIGDSEMRPRIRHRLPCIHITVGGYLWKKPNQCAVSSTQKFLVQQHITTSKHQANKQLNSKQRQLFLTQPTTSNVRSEFNIDLCRSLISADIPLYKLKNKSTLRKTYAPSIYDETIQKIRDEIKDSSIWVSIDETPDKEGRLVGNVVIGLLSEQYSERILLHCDVLEKCNNKTIVKLFNEAMGILWPKGIMYDNVLFFISDAAPYMVKAGQALSVVYPKLTHFTCVAHAFHRVAEVVRDNFLK
ncbi:hypothetical protein ANN_16183 [Periplaneta americana]|uniref:DUF659 domain-containing protein n=1 Tax=Periplaneta americana TaxID=6978 RepID=A0ABQ8SI95_PERAM|nr:hypothetical protein ANN_16183 [Periplaneta americana]